MAPRESLSPIQIARLSLVRFGANLLIILTTGVLNRLLMVEGKMPAIWVSFVLSLQNFACPLAICTGYISDTLPIAGRRRVPYIILWTLVTCAMVPLMPIICFRMLQGPLYFGLAVVMLLTFGLGVKASNLLISALLADRLEGEARGSVLTFIWGMAIFGQVVGGAIFAWFLPVYDIANPADQRDLLVLFIVAPVAVVLLTLFGTFGLEKRRQATKSMRLKYGLVDALRAVFVNPHARMFFVFLAIADFSFFGQQYILEAFGGHVFEGPVGETTSYNYFYGGGVLISMTCMGCVMNLIPNVNKRRVLIGGCLTGAVSFAMLTAAAGLSETRLVFLAVFILGLGKGIYNVGLAFMIMELVDRKIGGLLLGMWGAIGGLAVALGEFSGGAIHDGAYALTAQQTTSYAVVFGVELVGMCVCVFFLLRFSMSGYRERLNRELSVVFTEEGDEP
ncbi:MAG: BCD family MFS transporter [Planctomycetes bacterium]|nr:BCD family MFS transporter [Planctomycetota bacterium]